LKNSKYYPRCWNLGRYMVETTLNWLRYYCESVSFIVVRRIDKPFRCKVGAQFFLTPSYSLLPLNLFTLWHVLFFVDASNWFL
jgi:hypothetical protein